MNIQRYEVTFVMRGEKDAETREKIYVDADIMEMGAGVLILSKKIRGPNVPMEQVDFSKVQEGEEVPPPAIYTETVFLMPLHRVLHVQKVSPKGVH